jgi:hypothetical protein
MFQTGRVRSSAPKRLLRVLFVDIMAGQWSKGAAIRL